MIHCGCFQILILNSHFSVSLMYTLHFLKLEIVLYVFTFHSLADGFAYGRPSNKHSLDGSFF